jgi:hypothetical protein
MYAREAADPDPTGFGSKNLDFHGPGSDSGSTFNLELGFDFASNPSIDELKPKYKIFFLLFQNFLVLFNLMIKKVISNTQTKKITLDPYRLFPGSLISSPDIAVSLIYVYRGCQIFVKKRVWTRIRPGPEPIGSEFEVNRFGCEFGPKNLAFPDLG